MQASNPINTHAKFGKDRIHTFPSNERKPSIRMPDAGKNPTGVDIIPFALEGQQKSLFKVE